MEYFQKILEELERKSNLRNFPTAKHAGKYVELNNNKLLNLTSNDYLGISSNLEIKKNFLEKIDIKKTFFSASSSRLLSGIFKEYEYLENLLASLFHSEAALVFNSGYHANLGIIPAISNPETLILADKLVHASIIDGIILSKCDFIRYKHNNYEQLENLIKNNFNNYEKILIVTESIFSMDGDKANLKKLVELKENYKKILLYVDEAHAIGVFGETGLGVAEEENCIKDIDFLVGTFGKAIASIGAYLICSDLIRKYLINKMRSLIFSTALPPINIAWTIFIIESLKTFYNEREQLHRISKKIREVINKKKYSIESVSQIVPLVLGENKLTLEKVEFLQKSGFYALAVRPPTVPIGGSRIRFSLTATMSNEEISNLSKIIHDFF